MYNSHFEAGASLEKSKPGCRKNNIIGTRQFWQGSGGSQLGVELAEETDLKYWRIR
jgi:hypothetical protein